MTDTTIIRPTPERVRHAGETFVPDKIDQKTNRPYSRAKPSLDFLRDTGAIDEREWEAGDRIRRYHAGLRGDYGLVSSYGQQRWSGTLAKQESPEAMIRADWPTYCGDKLRQASATVGAPRTWEIILAVAADDLSISDAARRVCLSRQTAAKLLRDGLATLYRADYANLRPHSY